VLMGDLSLDELRALYPEPVLQRFTRLTPETVEALYDMVRADAERGYAISQSSFERGISVVTAPVRNDTGRIVGVITITIPRPEIDATLMETGLVDKVRHAAAELSSRLNYRPGAPRPYLKSLGLKS
jgi:DNA-binding IclR family transcriptional regulator